MREPRFLIVVLELQVLFPLLQQDDGKDLCEYLEQIFVIFQVVLNCLEAYFRRILGLWRRSVGLVKDFISQIECLHI